MISIKPVRIYHDIELDSNAERRNLESNEQPTHDGGTSSWCTEEHTCMQHNHDKYRGTQSKYTTSSNVHETHCGYCGQVGWGGGEPTRENMRWVGEKFRTSARHRMKVR